MGGELPHEKAEAFEYASISELQPKIVLSLDEIIFSGLPNDDIVRLIAEAVKRSKTLNNGEDN